MDAGALPVKAATLDPINRALAHRAAKPLVFLAALGPLGWYAWGIYAGQLGANPIEAVTRGLGDWGLRFLLLTLALTPLAKGLGLFGVARYRRMIGLIAFFYASLHLTNYLVIDQWLDFAAIWADIVKRLYITVGMVTWALLLPLALTSPKAMVRRLGGKRWKALHRIVYGAGVLAVVHFFMMVKADVREPLIYGAILALLLGYRLAKATLKGGHFRS